MAAVGAGLPATAAVGAGLPATAAIVAACLLLVVGCAAEKPRSDGAPARPPSDLASLPDPQPSVEPRSKYGNPPSYVVFGQTYYVMDHPDGYEESGLASWYGTKFHGQPTSSGEPYNMYKLTAAHRSLPIPTYVRITNLDNGKTAIVRVNDRGPFHSERLIDVSYAAAVKLGFADRGTARVHIAALTGSPEPEILVADRAPPVGAVAAPVLATSEPTATPRRDATADAASKIYLQAGAYRNRDGAERARSSLAALVGDLVQIDRGGDDGLFRVRVGPVASMAEASRLQGVLANARQGTPLIVRE